MELFAPGNHRSILRHSASNLAGLGLPLAAAVFTIPVLIRHLGNERFGLLTLIWAIVGYFGLFDFGLGRALTQQFSMLIARNEQARLGGLVTTSLTIMGGLGFLAGIIVWAGAPWGVSLLREVSDRPDAVAALRVMAFAMPFIVLTSGLRGILEARFAFGVLNLIRLPMGLLTFLGPLVVVVSYSTRLAPIALILSLGRLVACAAHAWCARRDLFGGAFDRMQLRSLLTSGGWMTVSNIISPLMGYADRFIIGGALSTALVAYYTTPNEMITKIWIIPGALTTVLFPRFAQDIVRDRAMGWSLFTKAVAAVFLITLPIALTLALFAPEILSLWVGKAFAVQSAPLLRIFALGILVNCMAHIPYTLIQSANRAHVTAFIHCGVFPIFIALLWLLTARFGLMGAAVSWLLRMTVDAALMFYFGIQTMGRRVRGAVDRKVTLAGLALIALFSGTTQTLWIRAGMLFLTLAFGAYAVFQLLRQGRSSLEGMA